MTFSEIYNQISNSATLFGLIFLGVIALWILVAKRIDGSKTK